VGMTATSKKKRTVDQASDDIQDATHVCGMAGKWKR